MSVKQTDENQPEPHHQPEKAGINLYAEYSLHAQLKHYFAQPGDRLEAEIQGKVVDLLRADGEIVEVQTGHFGQIKSKLLFLASKGYRVRLVYPIAVQTEIRRLNPDTGELLSQRRSPKRGSFYQLFAELIRAPELITVPHVTIQAVLVKSIDIKVRDGTGSWWRKGDRTVDRELAEVLSSQSFCCQSEWFALLPASLPEPYTTSTLAESLGIKPAQARQMLYCFSHAGLIAEQGKQGRIKLYRRSK